MLATPFLTLDNEIDGEAFQLLSDDDMKDLVPLFGPRAKLIKKRNEATSMTVTEAQNGSGATYTAQRMGLGLCTHLWVWG